MFLDYVIFVSTFYFGFFCIIVNLLFFVRDVYFNLDLVKSLGFGKLFIVLEIFDNYSKFNGLFFEFFFLEESCLG